MSDETPQDVSGGSDGARGRGPAVAVASGLAATSVLSGAAVMVRERRNKIRAQQVKARKTTAGVRALVATGFAGVLAKGLTSRRSKAGTVTARDIMSGGAECVAETDTLEEAARQMARLNVGALPICGADNRLKGMLTDRDIVVKCVAQQRDPALVTAAELAQGKPVTIGADDSVAAALRTMSDHKVRRLPVIDGHELVGVVAQADLARHIDEAQVGALIESISAAP